MAALRRQIIHLELLFGILAHLPLRSEAEIAHLVHAAAQFVALRAAPLLLEENSEDRADDQSDESCESCAGVCVASIMIHKLCLHSAGGDEAELKRLLAVAAENRIASGRGVAEAG